MTNNPTPTWQQLTDWLEGRLSPAEAARIEQRVAGADDSVAADAAWIRAFLRARDEISLDEPPASLRADLRTRFNEYASQQVSDAGREKVTDAGPNLFQRLAAALTFDSGLQTGLAGARAGEVAYVRQLIYSTNVLDISLTVRHERDGLFVDGQLLPLQDLALDAFYARIQRRDDVVAQTAVDEHGLFSFAAIRPDAYQFFLEADALSVWIESFNLHVRP